MEQMKVPKYWKKKNKDNPYFQGNYQNRESHDQRSTKNIRIRKNIPHTCTSWSKCMTCISLDPVFYLTIYVMQVYLSFHTYPKLHSKPLKIGWKEGKTTKCLGEDHTHWVIEWIIWGTYIYFTKFIKSPDRRLIKEWMIGNSVKPFYLATA